MESVRSAFIYSKEFLKFKPPKGYPWSVKRTETTYQLCRKLKLLNPEWISVHSPAPAKESEILAFHEKKYVNLLKNANKGVAREAWLKYGVGTLECPVYKGVYDYSRLGTGATLLGAKLIRDGVADIVFNPTGGFHHAGKDFAAGFCYINDIVLAAKQWLNKKKRVLYVEIDAHHGDQVQEAFYNSSRVMTVSFHESGKTLFPFNTGFETEIGKGRGRGYSVNVPLPEGTGDEEFIWAFQRVFPPLARAFKPDVVIASLGADGLFSDPLSNLRLTNMGLTQAVQMIKDNSPKLLALGCGGYSHENAVRAWTLEWAVLNNLGCNEEDLLSFGGTFWGDGICSLQDTPSFIPDEVREKNGKEIRRVVKSVRKLVFPIHKIGSPSKESI